MIIENKNIEIWPISEKGKNYFSIRFLTILLQWENGFSQTMENFLSVVEQTGPSIGYI